MLINGSYSNVYSTIVPRFGVYFLKAHSKFGGGGGAGAGRRAAAGGAGGGVEVGGFVLFCRLVF